MVQLIPKSERDNLGLNSWWRAIAWAATSLKAAASDPDVIDLIPDYSYKNAVRLAIGRNIANDALQGVLRIDATIPYEQSDGINNAGNFLPYLKNFHNGAAPPYTADSCTVLENNGYVVTGGGIGLPPEPASVNTLERYLVWVCQQGELELLDPLPAQLLDITVDFFEETSPNPTIKITAKIPLDYAAYRASGNFVCSVLKPGVILGPGGEL